MNDAPLHTALATIAGNDRLRDLFLAKLVEFDQLIRLPGTDLRELITGPLVDALFAEGETCRTILADGTSFEFLYRSKIARDLVMRTRANPDHVWEPQTTRLLVHLAGATRDAVIGGAYFGDQAILVARAISGVCHAFEPNPDQRSMLVRNAALNRVGNLVPVAKGLWDGGDTSLKLVGYDSFAHPEVTDAGSEDSFPTTSINAYCAEQGVASLGLIMLDIEGAELRALRGASALLEQPAATAPAVVFEVHRHYVDWSNGLENTEIVRLLAGHGYRVFAIRDYNSNVDMRGEPIELIPCDRVHLDGPPHGFNMLAVKDERRLDGLDVRYCQNVSPKLLRHRDPGLHQPCHRY